MMDQESIQDLFQPPCDISPRPVIDKLVWCEEKTEEKTDEKRTPMTKDEKYICCSHVLVPYCVMCKTISRDKGILVELNRCTRRRCEIVHYCSEACEKKHFPEHKKRCEILSNLKDGYEYWRGLTNEEFHSFEVMMGCWDDKFTKDFHILADIYKYYAHVTNMKETWEEALEYALVVLRIDSSIDIESLHTPIPCILFRLTQPRC
jgi:hypothetical protein